MAVNTSAPPWPPTREAIDLRRVVFDYDRESDTLAVYLMGRGYPSIVYPQRGGVDLLVEPQSEKVVGWQVEGFLGSAVLQRPQLLLLAELAGIAQDEIAAIRSRLDFDTHKRAGLDLLLASGVGA